MLILTHVVSINDAHGLDDGAHGHDPQVMCVVIETTYVLFESKIESTFVMIKCTLWFDDVEE